MRTRVPGRSLAMMLAAAVLLLVATACDPIVHGNLTVRANPGDGADLKMMSGDGRYVVLSATAAGPVVPGAGNWRVNRETGAVDALPAGTPTSISRDGSRVLIGSVNLWVNGTTSTSTGVLSPDLSARAFVGSDGTVQTQDVVTGVTRPVETAFPRPAGSTPTVLGVSDDGDTVMFHYGTWTESTVRIINLATSTKSDRAHPGGSISYRLSGSGTGLAITTWTEYCPPELFGSCIKSLPTVTLLHVPTGETIASYAYTSSDWLFGDTYLAEDGAAVWLSFYNFEFDGSGSCPSHPAAATCVTDTQLVYVNAGGTSVIGTGAGDILDLQVTPNGRFGVLTKEAPGWAGLAADGPVRILDMWSSGATEEFLTSGPSTPAYGFMTDSGGLVATSSNTGGWLEFSDQ